MSESGERLFLTKKNATFVFREQEHLSCFAPGMLALGASLENDIETISLAAKLTESCYQMYHQQSNTIWPGKIYPRAGIKP